MNMQLRDVINILESKDDSLCIVAKRPWTPSCEAPLVKLTVGHRVPPETLSQGYEYFLEVSVALDEVLSGLSTLLSSEQRVEALL